ncbi:3'-5' exonuclease [Nocardiopsis terrae]|uniref:3'-5' exonuclease n=1 Tax=Streptomyces sp. NPDC057554 TaxID=3350538 RepID=UPI00367730A5
MTKRVYLDCETTGLNPRIHHPWEIAVIVEEPGQPTREESVLLPVDLTDADPKALDIGGFWDRHPQGTDSYPGDVEEPRVVARALARLLADAVVIGSNPMFDKDMIAPFLAEHGQPWAAHYRTVDVITLGAGRLMGHLPQDLPTLGYQHPTLPYRTTDISRAFGVDPSDYARHTALGDCRWVRDLYRAITRKGADTDA